ncbi:MAG: hypothetical protein GY832_15450 [Chloroflexi bacterium]|nr:hypothetical protein [Chloroflexota bacterium]
MIWLSFGKWAHAAGRFFVSERIYWKGYMWTPFVRVQRRTCFSPWEIWIPMGHGGTASILYEGKEVLGVTRAQLDVSGVSLARLTLTVIPQNFRLKAYDIEADIVPLEIPLSQEHDA